MKLNLKETKNKEQWKGFKLYTFDRDAAVKESEDNPRWVHFGAGNIFRIFPARLCQDLLNIGCEKSGIIVGEGFDFEIIDRIYRPHDNLTMGVTLKANGSIDKEIIGSVAKAVKCDPSSAEDWGVLESAFRNPSLQMVSFTITEKGYALTTSDGSLSSGYKADFSRDIKDAEMFLSRLVRLLSERYNAGGAPLALVSMDNCSHNGEKLRGAVTAISEAYEKQGSLSHDTVAWLENEANVSFPWSMIDKITPRPDEGVRRMLEKDGFADTEIIITDKHTYIAPFVNAEEAEYLVIEDSFPNGRPALEKAGVYMTDRDTVNKVEKMKVCTCLNPLHTALALSGCLLGYTLIADEMKDGDLVAMVKRLGYAEGLPVVVNPGILDPKVFLDEVVDKRIPNPFMPDTPQRIATDTSQKLAIRFGETIKSYIAQKRDLSVLKVIPLVAALWCRYLMGLDDEGHEFTLSPDPMLDTVRPYVKEVKLDGKVNAESVLRPLFLNESIFGLDLTKTALWERIKSNFARLTAGRGAVRNTIHETVSE